MSCWVYCDDTVIDYLLTYNIFTFGGYIYNIHPTSLRTVSSTVTQTMHSV